MNSIITTADTVIGKNTAIGKQEKSYINTKLPQPFKIQPSPPTSIPNNLPLTALSKPKAHTSTLDNSVCVASQETYDQGCPLGIISNCGSRLEEHTSIEQICGVHHHVEL